MRPAPHSASSPVPTLFGVLASHMAGKSTIRKVIQVKMDAFFAFAEQSDNLTLRGRPVAPACEEPAEMALL